MPIYRDGLPKKVGLDSLQIYGGGRGGLGKKEGSVDTLNAQYDYLNCLDKSLYL